VTEKELEMLAERIRQSDEKAFETFFRRLYPLALAHAIQVLVDRDRAGDVVQEVFVNIWQQRIALDPKQNLRGYLLRSVKNRCLNVLRDTRHEVPAEEHHVVDLHDEPETGDPVQTVARLEEYLILLPARQQEALRLSRFDGLSHEEIASRMDISVRTVNNHIVAALRFLRQHAHAILFPS
jgi:RNA polymerase sigma-70 factor (ECF subfamily)